MFLNKIMTTFFCISLLLLSLPTSVNAQGNGKQEDNKVVLMPDGSYKSATVKDVGNEQMSEEKDKLTKAAKWRLKQQKKQEKIARKEFTKAQKQLKSELKDNEEGVTEKPSKEEKIAAKAGKQQKKEKQPKTKQPKEAVEKLSKEEKIAAKAEKKQNKEKQLKTKQPKEVVEKLSKEERIAAKVERIRKEDKIAAKAEKRQPREPKVVKTATSVSTTTADTEPTVSKPNNTSIMTVEESKPIIPNGKKATKNKKIERSSTDCAYAIDKIDVFTGKRRLATEPSFFFNHTPDKLKQFMRGKPFLTCTGYIADVGGMRTLNLNFTVDSPNAGKDYGGIEKGSKIYIKLLNGTTVYLYTQEGDNGSVDKGKGVTEFSTYFVIDPKIERKLKKSEINQMRMIWKVGYEDYEILEIDFIREHLSCLDTAH